MFDGVGVAMTGAELRCARVSMGLTEHALAEALTDAGHPASERDVRGWEKGRPVPAPVADGVRDVEAAARDVEVEELAGTFVVPARDWRNWRTIAVLRAAHFLAARTGGRIVFDVGLDEAVGRTGRVSEGAGARVRLESLGARAAALRAAFDGAQLSLRHECLDAVRDGHGVQDVAKWAGVSRQTLLAWRRLADPS